MAVIANLLAIGLLAPTGRLELRPGAIDFEPRGNGGRHCDVVLAGADVAETARYFRRAGRLRGDALRRSAATRHVAGRGRDDRANAGGGSRLPRGGGGAGHRGPAQSPAAQDRRAAQRLSGRDLASLGAASASETALSAPSPSQLDLIFDRGLANGSDPCYMPPP